MRGKYQVDEEEKTDLITHPKSVWHPHHRPRPYLTVSILISWAACSPFPLPPSPRGQYHECNPLFLLLPFPGGKEGGERRRCGRWRGAKKEGEEQEPTLFTNLSEKKMSVD